MTAQIRAQQAFAGREHSGLPEFRDITTNDWFSIKDQFSEFRILRNDDLSHGYEEFYQVQPGFHIRIYKCIESIALHDRIEVPRGLLHCLFNLSGNTELQIQGRGTRALVSPSLYVTFFPAKLVLIDTPVLHDQERLFVHLIIDPQEHGLETLGIETSDLPTSLRPAFSGNGKFLFRSFPLRGGLLYSLKQATAAKFSPAINRLYYRAKASELICHVFDQMSKRDIEVDHAGYGGSDFAKIDEVRSFVEENLVSSPTLEELASRFGMSGSKLKRVFKSTHGVSIGNYRQALRMYKARDMLRNSSRSVSQVALQLGYEHTSSFITAFKRSFGTTPKSYRGLLRSG